MQIENQGREDIAANEYVAGQDYSGSVEALALKNVFIAGAMNEGASADARLVAAFEAGMKWNAEQWAATQAILAELSDTP